METHIVSHDHLKKIVHCTGMTTGDTEDIVEKVLFEMISRAHLLHHIFEFPFQEQKPYWPDSIMMIYRSQTDPIATRDSNWGSFRGYTIFRASIACEKNHAVRGFGGDRFQIIVPKFEIPIR